MSPTGSDPATGELLPREAAGFRLLKELGRGGMGVVYEAEELASGRRVALKVLPARLAVSDEALERFRREARLAAAISDSRCVFVYGAHEFEGCPAIAMELCEGRTLQERLREGAPVPIQDAVRWTLEILEGLEAAHRAGVLHRDVKPSNCFLTPDGHVKVGDFGLSRSLQSDARLTLSGQFLGTPTFASPEQVRGTAVDLRSDLYSVGATLYNLLTGRPPFRARGIGELMAQVLETEPEPPRSLRRDIPRALEKAVLRAMAKDPRRRFPDHAAFRAALQGYVGEAAAGILGWRFVACVIDVGVASGIHVGTLALAAGLGMPGVVLDLSRASTSTAFNLLVHGADWLYLALCEGIFGATVGKWLMGQRVVSVASGHPSLRRAALRAAVFTSPSVLVTACSSALELSEGVYALSSLVASLIGLAFLATMRRRNGYRAVYELASGTRVIQVQPAFARRPRTAAVPSRRPEAAPGLSATVGVYQVEGRMGRTPLGPLLRGRDPTLGRTVWIQACVEGEPALDDARRALVRAGRLRWVDVHEEKGVRYEVFEDPGGAPFAEVIRDADDWPRTHRLLLALTAELSNGGPESSELAARGNCQEQIWLDRGGHLRVLDEPIGPGPFRFLPPLDLVRETARSMCGGSGTTGLPPGLPYHAEDTMRRICGLGVAFEGVDAAHDALAAMASRPQALACRVRATQIATAAIVSAFLLLCVGGLFLLMETSAGRARDRLRLERLLAEDFRSMEPQRLPPEVAEERRARMTLISHYLALPWIAGVGEKAQGERREIMEEARRIDSHPTTREVEQAAGRLAPRAGAAGLEVEDIYEDSHHPARRVIVGTLAGWLTLVLLLTTIFRGGVSLRVFGMRIRDRRGARASRLRCAARALVLWSPLIVLILAVADLRGPARETLGPLVLALVAIYAIGAVWSVWNPARGPHDLLAGTRLVPR